MEVTLFLVSALAAGVLFSVVMALRARTAGNRMTTVATALGKNALPDLRELQLSAPWHERVLKPLLRRLYRLGQYFTPSQNIENLQHKLVVAGLPGSLSVTDFLGLRFLVAAMVGAVTFTVMAAQQPVAKALLFAIIAFVVGLYLPNFWLSSKARARQKSIARSLPDALDMMSICVDAGLGFEAAIQKVAYNWENELAVELRRVISEIRVGVARGEALRHLAERTDVPEVSGFVGVMVQADRLGIPVRNVLNTQSVQMRIKRRQRAQELAAQAPVKMMIPLALFIFPALFAIILGPAVPRILEAFG